MNTNTKNEDLLAGLQTDLSAEYQAIVMYNTFAASVVGVHRKELEGFFRAEVPDELRHAEFLANKIAALGGVPTTSVEAMEVPDTARGMLEAAMTAETDTIHRYKERRLQADALGDVGLVNDLEELISDETKHQEECEKMLRGQWE